MIEGTNVYKNHYEFCWGRVQLKSYLYNVYLTVLPVIT